MVGSYCHRLRKIDTAANTSHSAACRTVRSIRPGLEVLVAAGQWGVAAVRGLAQLPMEPVAELEGELVPTRPSNSQSELR